MEDLFEVFGGRDNLRLMCEAEDFYENTERRFIRFRVKDKYMCLCVAYKEYILYLYDRETQSMVLKELAEDAGKVRELFECYTGYALSF